MKKDQLARKTGKTLFLSRLNKTEVHQLVLIFIQQNKKENGLQMQKKELELNFGKEKRLPLNLKQISQLGQVSAFFSVDQGDKGS